MPTKPNQFSGKLTVARTTSSSRDAYISLYVTDEISGVQFLRGEMSVLEFAECLFGNRDMPLKFTLCRPDLIGTIAEHKKIEVPYTRRFASNEAELIEAALKPFEVDGWRADREDMTNRHRRTQGGQSVMFRRHIHADTKAPVLT